MPSTNTTRDNDGTFEACLAYLNTKGHVLWGDYSLNPTEDGSGHYRNEAAARWLEAQVRGVAEQYDTPARTYAAPAPARDETPPWYGAVPRPSALVTHGQQAERW